MSLEEQIKTDIITAMKAGNKFETNTLRSIHSQIKDERIKLRPKRELTPEDVISVLLTAAKRRKEALALYRQGKRDDLVEKEQKELEIIQRYLPKQMSEEEVAKIIDEIISEVQAKSVADLGKVMGKAMGRLKGKTDGGLVQNLVRERLTQIAQ